MTVPLTVGEARAILVADEALVLSYEARLATGQTFGTEALDAWANLVESAVDRIAVFEGPPKEAPRPSTEPDRYPGGNELGFQTQFLLAMAAGAAKRSVAPEAEAQALRTGIETILKAFGTNSAEWAQQSRALLDRVPVRAERARLAAPPDVGPPWLADLAEALGKIAPSGKALALNWTQTLELVRQLRRDLLAVCAIATTPLPEDRQTVVEACRRWL